MSASKPKIAIYRYKERPDDLRSGWRYVRLPSHVPRGHHGEALIRLSDYEALQAECEKLRKDAERYQSLLEAVLREIPHREGRRGNAPGHGHSVPGVWDCDNGALAGKECAWCKVWNEALTAMQEERNP